MLPATMRTGSLSVGRGLISFVRRKPVGGVGLIILILLVLVGMTGPWISPYDPLEMSRDRFLQPPSWAHPFGTDVAGRDMLSRVMAGAQISLYVGFVSVFASAAVASFIGITCAYYGGKYDLIVQRIVDVIIAFPTLILALAIMAALGQGLNNVVIAVSFSAVPRIVRVVRGSALSVKEELYVQAAVSIGASNARIMYQYIFKNSLAPLIIMATAMLGQAIVTEATLSFLGVGVPPPHPSWGRMIAGAAGQYAEAAPWLLIFPGLALTLVVYAFNIVGDAVRDVWDPRLRAGQR